MVELLDPLMIPEQAGFRPGKNSTGQILSMCQLIEDGKEIKLLTGGVFVDLTAAYDTVNKKNDPKAAQIDTKSSSHYLDSRIFVEPTVFCANRSTQKQIEKSEKWSSPKRRTGAFSLQRLY